MPRATATAAALLLHGEERFLVDERARAALDEWKPGLVSDFGLDTLEGAGLTPARLQDAILQLPFLDPRDGIDQHHDAEQQIVPYPKEQNRFCCEEQGD